MKKMLIIGGVLAALSFVGGLAGFYLMMPSVAPTLVQETKLELDSLGLISYHEADSIRAMRDSVRAHLDSVHNAPLVPLETTLPPIHNLPSTNGVVDSLRLVLERIRAMETEKTALLTQIEALTNRIHSIEERRVEAENMSGTLSKLEDRQLGPILQNLDDAVLELIYLKSAAKTQARLLAALPADRAARFIRELVRANPGAAAGPAPARPASAPAADGSPQH